MNGTTITMNQQQPKAYTQHTTQQKNNKKTARNITKHSCLLLDHTNTQKEP